MHVISRGELYHRTQLMEEAQAERFARCVAANRLFESVSIEESKTARSAKRYFVRYQPSNDARQRDLVKSEMVTREARAAEQVSEYLFVLDDTGRFFHCLSYASGEVYEVTQHSCSCGDHTYRGAAVGPCKHIRMLRSGKADVRGWAQEAQPVQAEQDVAEKRAQAKREREQLW